MRTRFQQGLDELKERLLTMGGMAEQAVDRAVEAHRLQDITLCRQVFDNEPGINRAERAIDQLAIDLLAMQQPMAVDLRFITAVMKINADLERVGDQAVNIAERVIDMNAYPQVELPVDIPRIAGIVSGMVRRALEAFIHGKADVAEAVLKMDNVVDEMNEEAFVALANRMHESREVTRQALDTLLIVRNLERVADHATNIAEDVIFWVRGTDVRHLGPEADQGEAPQVSSLPGQ